MMQCLLGRPGAGALMETAVTGGPTMRGTDVGGGLLNLQTRRVVLVDGSWKKGRRVDFVSDASRGRATAVLPSRVVSSLEKGSFEREDQGVLRIAAGSRLGFGCADVEDNARVGRCDGGSTARGRWAIGAAEADLSPENENSIVQNEDTVVPDENSIVKQAIGALHLAVSLAGFLAFDLFLKQRFSAAGIKFPSALFGMHITFIFLNLTSYFKPWVTAAFIGFFQPAILFIQRWLPVFYVPSLVVVPLAIQGIPPTAQAKIALILGGGWVASLAVAGFTAVAVRSFVKTELAPAEYTPKPAPFADWEVASLAVAMVASFALAIFSPTALGSAAVTAAPFFLSATALGYVVGSNLPAGVRKIFHPIITCAITADVAALVFGYFSKAGFEGALNLYLTKQAGNPGAGDLFMAMLGSVIISFAFSMFNQRKLVMRHAPEIFTAVAATGVFSLYSTAVAGRLIGLPPDLTLAIVPRCITVALALPIAGLLDAGNASVTAAVVVLTGLVGANFTQLVMDKFRFGDPISRGLATACSAHGLGTAALSAKEPEALPFCAIAYALTGIFCSVLVTLPAVQRSLILVAGTGAGLNAVL